MTYNTKKAVTILVMSSILLTAVPTSVTAKTIDDEIYEDTILATELLEDVLKSEYERDKETAEEYVITNNFDYTLSMESLADKDSPFTNADYQKLIAAYLCIADNDNTIYDMDFIKPQYEAKIHTDYEPYKIHITDKADPDNTEVRYINEPTTIKINEKMVDITPNLKETEYVDIAFTLLTGEDLIAKYAPNKDSEYKKRLEILKQSGLSAQGLSQSIMISHAIGDVLTDEEQGLLSETIEELEGNRRIIVETAASLIGRIPYEWGGKATKAGYDASWWTFTEAGKQKGLDCSGFVSWTYETSGYEGYKELLSTGTILNNTVPISEAELQPGDLGLLNNGETINHTGIYVGNGYYIHCSSASNTVTMSRFPFKIHRRVKDIDEVTLEPLNYTTAESTYNASDEEIYLLAQLVCNEARGQGYNGWVGVTEVVLNRIADEQFPSDVEGVIYAPGQFADNDRIKTQIPSDEILKTVRDVVYGNVRIFDNPDVLYFRNPHEEGDVDWGSHKTYMRINDHVFYLQ